MINKYGLKGNPYQFVISYNQKGGQTGQIIINNYSPNSHVVNGDNLGINGDVNVYNKFELTDQEIDYLADTLTSVMYSLGKEKNQIYLKTFPGSNMDVQSQLARELPKRGIRISGTGSSQLLKGSQPLNGFAIDSSGDTLILIIGVL